MGVLERCEHSIDSSVATEEGIEAVSRLIAFRAALLQTKNLKSRRGYWTTMSIAD